MLNIFTLGALGLSYLWDHHVDKKNAKQREELYAAIAEHQRQEIEKLKAQLANKD